MALGDGEEASTSPGWGWGRQRRVPLLWASTWEGKASREPLGTNYPLPSGGVPAEPPPAPGRGSPVGGLVIARPRRLEKCVPAAACPVVLAEVRFSFKGSLRYFQTFPVAR